jgi:hypothetical protein
VISRPFYSPARSCCGRDCRTSPADTGLRSRALRRGQRRLRPVARGGDLPPRRHRLADGRDPRRGAIRDCQCGRRRRGPRRRLRRGRRVRGREDAIASGTGGRDLGGVRAAVARAVVQPAGRVALARLPRRGRGGPHDDRLARASSSRPTIRLGRYGTLSVAWVSRSSRFLPETTVGSVGYTLSLERFGFLSITASRVEALERTNTVNMLWTIAARAR